MEQYCILGRIGEGAHGIVFKAKHVEVSPRAAPPLPSRSVPPARVGSARVRATPGPLCPPARLPPLGGVRPPPLVAASCPPAGDAPPVVPRVSPRSVAWMSELCPQRRCWVPGWR